YRSAQARSRRVFRHRRQARDQVLLRRARLSRVRLDGGFLLVPALRSRPPHHQSHADRRESAFSHGVRAARLGAPADRLRFSQPQRLQADLGAGTARHRSQSFRLSSRSERVDHRAVRGARSDERGARVFRAAAVAPRPSAETKSVAQGSVGCQSVGHHAARRDDEIAAVSMIRRRHVYHVAGYDPIDAGAQYRRFARQLDVFRRTWNVEATLSALEQSTEQSRAWWSVSARAANWQVEAGHEALLWDDIVRGDFTRPLPLRLFKAARAYLDFIVTGTMFRYIFADPRYAIFFLFPILSVVLFPVGLFAVGGWLAAHLLTAFLGLEGMAAAAGMAVGVAVFLLLLRWPGGRWRVQQLLDDWICANDYLHGRRPDIDARLDRFAETLLARAREAAVDGIVLVGHSLGGVLRLRGLVRAL